MKALKIIIGFLLIFGAGKEYIIASSEVGSLLSPGIVMAVILMLFFSTWLIGSGFSSKSLKSDPKAYIKFFIIALVTFVIVAIVALGARAMPGHYIESNGLRVPIKRCIEGNKRIIPNEKERVLFCTCLVEKITENPRFKSKYQSALENNRINEVYTELKNSLMFSELGIQGCFSQLEMKWTDGIENSIRKNLKQELSGTNFNTTNNIEKYCDCIIDAYRKLPLQDVLDSEFSGSVRAIEIQVQCELKSKKH